MSEQVEMTNPVEMSVGGVRGHLFRRLFHLGMITIPIAYYIYGHDIADLVNTTRDKLTSILLICLIVVEFGRLKLGITIFGQREYEANQVSALAWGAFGITMCVLAAPEVGKYGAGYGMPVILCLVFGDPALGEIRRMGASQKSAFIWGSLVCLVIWVVCWNIFDTPLWLAPIMALICTASEWPRLRWIDDNATMVLIPLCAIIILHPLTGL